MTLNCTAILYFSQDESQLHPPAGVQPHGRVACEWRVIATMSISITVVAASVCRHGDRSDEADRTEQTGWRERCWNGRREGCRVMPGVTGSGSQACPWTQTISMAGEKNVGLLTNCIGCVSSFCSLPTRPSAPSKSLLRSKSRTDLSHNGFVFVLVTPSSKSSCHSHFSRRHHRNDSTTLTHSSPPYSTRYNAKRRHWRRTKLGL